MTFSFRLLCAPLLLAWLAGACLPAAAQRVDWAQKLQDIYAPTDGVGGQLAVDTDGNSYLIGSFSGTVTLGTITLGDPATTDQRLFVAKFDSTGGVVWAKTEVHHALSYMTGYALAVDSLHNLYISGQTSGDVQLGAHRLTGGGHFVASFDARDGTCRWARLLTEQMNSAGRPLGIAQLTVDNTGDCLLIGHCLNADSLGELPLVHRNTHDAYVARLAPTGRLRWVRQLRGRYSAPATNYYFPVAVNMAVDPAGNCVVVGSFTDTLTVAPGHALYSDTTLLLSQRAHSDAYVVKYDRAGNYVWAKQSHSVWGQIAGYVATDTHGNVLVQLANMINSLPMDLDGHVVIGPSGLFKFSGAGVFQWVIDRGNGWDYSPIATDADDNVYVAGNMGTALNCFRPDGTERWQVQYPPRPSWRFYAVSLQLDGARNAYLYGGADSVVTLGNIRLEGSYFSVLARVSPRANELTGRIFLDANQSGTLDAGEQGFPHFLPLDAGPGSTYTPYARGGYRVFTGIGAYDLHLLHYPPHYTLTTPASYTGNFSGYGAVVADRDFGLAPVANQQDLRVTLTAYTPARRGVPMRYQARVENVGTTTIASGTVTVQIDPAATIIGTTPPAPAQGQTRAWTFTNLAPFASRSYDITLSLPLNVAVGQSLVSSAAVTPLIGDVAGNDNFDELRQIVVGSSDPNDISVNFSTLTQAQITAGTPLDYVVNFQNMGTDTAFAVLIQDSLPAGLLQLATIDVVSQSHSVRWRVVGPGLLSLEFPGIKLPQRAVDAVRSQGFVRFRITPRTTLTAGTLIPNRAHITFDFNAVEPTNQVTTRVEGAQGLPGVAGAARFTLYPNPAAERVTLTADLATAGQVTVRVVDALGRPVRTEVVAALTGPLRHTLDLRGIAAGFYTVQLTQPDGAATSRKLVVR